MGSCIRYW